MPASVTIQAERSGASGGGELVYRISTQAGAEGAAFGFEYGLPNWSTPGVVGSPLLISAVNLNGPGSLRPAKSPPVPKPALKKEEVCLREKPSPFATAYWLEVPPGASTNVELHGRSSYPSWPSARFDLAFATFDADSPLAVRSPLPVSSEGPLALGPKGVRLSIDVVEGAQGSNARRMTPRISGRTAPVLRNARIWLRAILPSPGGAVSISDWSKASPASVRVGTVRTDAQGRFRLLPRPFPFAGRYALIARSQAKGGLVADWNCGPFF